MARASDSTLKDRVRASRADKAAVRATLKAALVGLEQERKEEKRAARAAMTPQERALADSYRRRPPGAAAGASGASSLQQSSSSSAYAITRAEFWGSEEGDDDPGVQRRARAPRSPSAVGSTAPPPNGDRAAGVAQGAPAAGSGAAGAGVFVRAGMEVQGPS